MSRKRYGNHHGNAFHEELRSAAPEILFKAAKGFDPSRGYKFSTYAGTALWRGFMSIEKYEARRQGSHEHDDSRVYKDRGLDRAEIDAALIDVGLTERDQQIIHAYFVDEFSKQEIADMLGTTFGIVKRTIEKKLKMVAPRLDPDDLRPEPPPSIKAVTRSRRTSGKKHTVPHVRFPHDDGVEEQEVRVTGGHFTMEGSILDQIRQDPELAAKRQRNRQQQEEDAKAMERWYADLRRERE